MLNLKKKISLSLSPELTKVFDCIFPTPRTFSKLLIVFFGVMIISAKNIINHIKKNFRFSMEGNSGATGYSPSILTTSPFSMVNCREKGGCRRNGAVNRFPGGIVDCRTSQKLAKDRIRY